MANLSYIYSAAYVNSGVVSQQSSKERYKTLLGFGNRAGAVSFKVFFHVRNIS